MSSKPLPLPEPFPGEPACGYEMRTAIDWNKYRAVVFESDDWGACEQVRNKEDVEILKPVLDRLGAGPSQLDGTLETPNDLEQLYRVLENARGCDNRPAVFSAFMPMGNPDFAAIAKSVFQEYHDIGLNEGLPPGWERGDLIGKWREGVARGVFAPEFHAGLHHISPILWLELLRGEGAESQAARAIFELNGYAQSGHLPEYHRMNAKAQYAWVSRAIARFENLFGFSPRAGVTSDALPMTEIIWSVNGLEIFCLKNCRINSGGNVAYFTKLWNSQDVNCPMGAYNRRNDLVYLNRNLHLDGLQLENVDEIKSVIAANWQRNEPTITNNHRINYVNLQPEKAETGRRVLSELLSWICAQDGVRFLTTGEVGQLYRDGYSVRQIGAEKLVRQWSQPEMEVRISGPIERVIALPSGQEQAFSRDGNQIVLQLKEGDYLAR
jgi:hypothetical protein